MARDSRETESATLPFDDLPAPRRSVEVVGEELPLLATRDDVYFPGQVFPLAVVRPQERDAVKAALAADRRVVVVATRLGASESPCPADFYSVGIVAEILSEPSGDGETEGMAILLEGVSRVRAEISGSCEMRRARVVPLAEPAAATGDPRLAALARTVRAGFEELTEESIGIPPDAVGAVRAEIDPLGLPNLVAPWLEAPVATKQALLEETHAERRLERLAALIQRERDNLRVDPILDDDSSDGGVWEELFQRLETAAPPLEIARRAESALKRLARAPASTAETEGLQHWIETLLSIPWNAEAEERVDLPEAERLLDAAHFGQESVKERLLEFLAVRKLAGNRLRPPLLCFVGAPGVGKTSVALSLAEALGRPCVRVALGGVRDEAEIRGHRRTYVGAMPGRIVAAIRQSGVKNPVIVLDELDKLASDLRGDPASALLEALDPEQNHAFHDHYLDVPLDLSQVLFVATANRADTILPALRDRLELVAFPSYTEREKVGIAQKHLLPRQREAHALEPGDLELTGETVRALIAGWTGEAGVRELERKLGALCRKAARKRAGGEEFAPPMPESLAEWLGPPPLRPDPLPPPGAVGVALGLAFTERGGETLPVECALTPGLPGETRLTVTGSAGEVLRESARTALSFLASNLDALGLTEGALSGRDVHIHFPSGATPKDGPSAGVAIACALASALLNRPLAPGLAMTGELTLRGQVLPIGGLRDKLLAARRSGVRTVLLPAENQAEIDALPPEVTDGLTLVAVRSGREALDRALSAN